MIDFLNLKEYKPSCECLKQGYSLHLLPNNPEPYLFYIGNEGNHVKTIDVIDSYGNSTNILTQSIYKAIGYVELKNINYDDINNVILKLTFNDNNILYSDPIKISSKNSCKTTRVYYKCKENDILQNLSFPIWKLQDKRNVELESYYQISTKSPISYSVSNSKYSTYQTDFINIDSICKLSDILQYSFVYFDKKRVVLYEAVEIPERQADETFGQTQINISKYSGINDEDLANQIFVLGNRQLDEIIQDGDKNIINTEPNGN